MTTLRTELIEQELRQHQEPERPARPTDDQRFRADLEAAPANALGGARKERKRLDDLVAKAAAADQALVDARTRVVDATVSGTPDAGAQRAVESAKAKARDAAEAVDEQRQIVAEIERRLVEGVRARRAAEAEADAGKAHARYDAALLHLRAALTDGLATMLQARTDEQAAMAAIASARGSWVPGSIPDEVTRIVFGLDDNSGQLQRLATDETLVRLVRRTQAA